MIILGSMLFWAGCSAPPPATPPPTSAKPTSTPPPAAAQAQAPAPAASDQIKQAAAKPSAPFDGEGWQSLFDGRTLTGWRTTDFAGRGEVECQSGLIVLGMGNPFTGVNWTNDFPKTNYEIALDAMRVMGSDFFCGLTVPVGDTFCSLIVGGWGGTLVGISSLDGMDASENETMKYLSLQSGRWYRIRLRVTPARIQAWLDEEKLVDVEIKDRRVSLRPGDIEMSKPCGIASYQTTAALRQVRMRLVPGPAGRSQ